MASASALQLASLRSDPTKTESIIFDEMSSLVKVLQKHLELDVAPLTKLCSAAIRCCPKVIFGSWNLLCFLYSLFSSAAIAHHLLTPCFVAHRSLINSVSVVIQSFPLSLAPSLIHFMSRVRNAYCQSRRSRSMKKPNEYRRSDYRPEALYQLSQSTSSDRS